MKYQYNIGDKLDYIESYVKQTKCETCGNVKENVIASAKTGTITSVRIQSLKPEYKVDNIWIKVGEYWNK